jgi:hypothetical protein
LGANPAGGLYLAWITANTSPETTRAIATGLVPAIGSLGSVAGKLQRFLFQYMFC